MTARVLLLTEDSARDAHATVKAILQKLLQHVVPHDARALVVEAPGDQVARGAKRNAWKEVGKAEAIAMRRAVATQLAQAGKFVVFHVDADVRWADREASDNIALFERRVRQPLRQLLHGRGTRAEQLEGLLVLHPHYSIEAWLYQNTREALRIAGEERCAHGCTDKLEAWGRDRALLDEVPMPKEETCLRDRHNLALTRGYPTSDVVEVGKSFAAARDELASNRELLGAVALRE